MIIIKRLLPQALVISLGLLSLLGLLFVSELAQLLTGWAGFLGAIALLIGVINLLGVHVRRSRQGNVYSVALVIAMLSVFAIAVTDALQVTDSRVDTVFDHVLVPLEAALSALMAIFMLYALLRMIQRRPGPWTLLFVGGALLLLITQSRAWLGVAGLLSPIGSLLRDVIVSAGMRGLLIGIALGIITIGIRLLLGLDRQFE